MKLTSEVILIVKEAIDHYDPIRFLKNGAAPDEYLYEAMHVAKSLLDDKEADLSEIVSDVFKKQLGETVDPDVATAIAKRIIINLKD